MLGARPLALHDEVPRYPPHTKTPGRALKGRNTLQENLGHHGATTVNGKGKLVQTPHRPAVQGLKAVKDGKPIVTVPRPLFDKTPLPNRLANAVPFKTPAPQTAKLAKLSLLDPAPACTPRGVLRPSSTRKSLRTPRSGSAKHSFETPVTQGNHWDVSDGDVSMDVQVGAEEKETVHEDDYDEIEYMPPSAIDVPYEPPFDMPDYKVAGRQLFEFAHSCPVDDSADHFYAADIDTMIDTQELLVSSGFSSSPSIWNYLQLPELEDDSIFGIKTSNDFQVTVMSKSTMRPSASRVAAASRVVPAPRPVPSTRPTTTMSTCASSRLTVSAATGSATSSATRTASTSANTLPSKVARTRVPSLVSTAAPRRKGSVYATTTGTTTNPTTGVTLRAASTARKPSAAAAKGKSSVYATTTATSTSKPLPNSTRLRALGPFTSRTIVAAAAEVPKDSMVLEFAIGGLDSEQDFKFDV